MAMLSGHTHHLSTVVCARDTELVKLGRNAFNVLQEQYPQVLRQVTRVRGTPLLNIYVCANVYVCVLRY